MSEQRAELHIDSGQLWTQIRGKVDYSFQNVLQVLDNAQSEEEMSPFLAEAIRDMFFQLGEEDPKRLNNLLLKSLGGPGLKFILTQCEDGGGNYRLRKSAELIGASTGYAPGDIIVEYMAWITSEK